MPQILLQSVLIQGWQSGQLFAELWDTFVTNRLDVQAEPIGESLGTRVTQEKPDSSPVKAPMRKWTSKKMLRPDSVWQHAILQREGA